MKPNRSKRRPIRIATISILLISLTGSIGNHFWLDQKLRAYPLRWTEEINAEISRLQRLRFPSIGGNASRPTDCVADVSDWLTTFSSHDQESVEELNTINGVKTTADPNIENLNRIVQQHEKEIEDLSSRLQCDRVTVGVGLDGLPWAKSDNIFRLYRQSKLLQAAASVQSAQGNASEAARRYLEYAKLGVVLATGPQLWVTIGQSILTAAYAGLGDVLTKVTDKPTLVAIINDARALASFVPTYADRLQRTRTIELSRTILLYGKSGSIWFELDDTLPWWSRFLLLFRAWAMLLVMETEAVLYEGELAVLKNEENLFVRACDHAERTRAWSLPETKLVSKKFRERDRDMRQKIDFVLHQSEKL